MTNVSISVSPSNSSISLSLFFSRMPADIDDLIPPAPPGQAPGLPPGLPPYERSPWESDYPRESRCFLVSTYARAQRSKWTLLHIILFYLIWLEVKQIYMYIMYLFCKRSHKLSVRRARSTDRCLR